jgi:serine/threonine-protein kinase
MKLVIGETLERTLSRLGPSRLDPEVLASLLEAFVRVCGALSFAHGRGVLHRDIKPANVMVGASNQVYVMDWGLAKRTPRACSLAGPQDSDVASDRPGFLIGTPCYMAPEQLRGLHERVDERTDVFGLGAMLYQFLSGQPPHDRHSLTEVALQNARVRVRPPDAVVQGRSVPPELSRIALKAMSHDSADRYSSVDELCRDVALFRTAQS